MCNILIGWDHSGVSWVYQDHWDQLETSKITDWKQLMGPLGLTKDQLLAGISQDSLEFGQYFSP